MAEALRVGHEIDGEQWSIDRCMSSFYRVEAIGANWVVLRDDYGHAHFYDGDPEDLLAVLR